MAILVGSPGSGKSTFTFNHLKDYVRINRDTLKTKEKCLSEAEKNMKLGKNVVIDNTNPTKDDRKPYIDLAVANNYKCICFYFDFTKELVMHLDNQREFNAHRKHFSKRVGRIPIHSFYKHH